MASGDPSQAPRRDLVATEVQPRRREPVGELAERRLQQRPRRRDAGVQHVVDEVLDADAHRSCRADRRSAGSGRQGGEAVPGQVDLGDQHDARALGASVPAGDVVGRVDAAVRRGARSERAVARRGRGRATRRRSVSSGKPATGTRHASSSVRCRCNRLSPCQAATSTSHSTSTAGKHWRARSTCRPRHPDAAAECPPAASRRARSAGPARSSARSAASGEPAVTATPSTASRRAVGLRRRRVVDRDGHRALTGRRQHRRAVRVRGGASRAATAASVDRQPTSDVVAGPVGRWRDRTDDRRVAPDRWRPTRRAVVER